MEKIKLTKITSYEENIKFNVIPLIVYRLSIFILINDNTIFYYPSLGMII